MLGVDFNNDTMQAVGPSDAEAAACIRTERQQSAPGRETKFTKSHHTLPVHNAASTFRDKVTGLGPPDLDARDSLMPGRVRCS